MAPIPSRRNGTAIGLAATLDRIYREHDRENAVTDPIEAVRPYADPADREIVGFCAAGLAFGRVGSVMQSIRRLTALMAPHPAAFVRTFDPAAHREAFAGLEHRWIRGADMAALLWVLRQMLERSGSIESFFLEGDDPASADVGPALESFSRRALGLDLTRAYTRGPGRPGVSYFFARPSSGGACKRLNLFLRWMVRRDAVDLGVWTGVSPSRLVVPLDTHVIRLAACLGLTRYRSPGWRMAADITASLRRLDPADPVRFDFSICHVGMRGLCGFGTRRGDRDCPFRGACRPRRGPRRASVQP